MKNLKKTTAVLTAAALMSMSMGMTALADQTLNGAGDVNIGVTGTYDGSTHDGDPVYKVDINWGSMEFTYEANVTRTWNPTAHMYETSNGLGKWAAAKEGVSNKVTVINHSNAGISGTLSFAGNNGIAGSFSDNNAENQESATFALTSAESTTDQYNGTGEARTYNCLFNITAGSLSADSDTNIGSITVTVKN